jgi:hypothetical protein
LVQGAKIGIGVGIPLGIALVVVIGLFMYRERRNKQKIAKEQRLAMELQRPKVIYMSPPEEPNHSQTCHEAPTENYQKRDRGGIHDLWLVEAP